MTTTTATITRTRWLERLLDRRPPDRLARPAVLPAASAVRRRNRQTWSQERDRFWDRRAQRWQRDDQALPRLPGRAAGHAAKHARDRTPQAERMREAARQERARAAARREQVFERAAAAACAREKQRRQEDAKAAARGRSGGEGRDGRGQRQKEDAKSAAEKKERAKPPPSGGRRRRPKPQRPRRPSLKGGAGQGRLEAAQQEPAPRSSARWRLTARQAPRRRPRPPASRSRRQRHRGSKAAIRKQAAEDSAAQQKEQYCKNHPKDKQCSAKAPNPPSVDLSRGRPAGTRDQSTASPEST